VRRHSKLLLVFTPLLLGACALLTANADRPPIHPTRTPDPAIQALTDIRLTTADRGQIRGEVISVCDPGGCVDEHNAPIYHPDDFAALPDDPHVFLAFGEQVPDRAQFSLLVTDQEGRYTVPYGNTMFLSPTVSTASWDFNIEPGRYVLEVYCAWEDGYQVYVQWPVIVE
jgi:hypothetical protein